MDQFMTKSTEQHQHITDVGSAYPYMTGGVLWSPMVIFKNGKRIEVPYNEVKEMSETSQTEEEIVEEVEVEMESSTMSRLQKDEEAQVQNVPYQRFKKLSLNLN